jgi:hypothetical protein
VGAAAPAAAGDGLGLASNAQLTPRGVRSTL